MEKGIITSSANSRVRNVINLKNKAKERREQDLFLVEGIRMFLEAPANRIEQVYMSDSFYRKNGKLPQVRAMLEKTGYDLVSDAVFEAMSDTKTPQGILCLIRRFHYDPGELTGRRGPALVLALEDLQDPGNLGTIVRSAEGAGVTGILLGSGCVDIYNPKVIRSTMGSVYRVPFAYTQDLEGIIQDWKQEGIRVYAAHLAGKRSYDRENYTGASVFLVGNESKGLSEAAAGLADCYIRIPMLGQVESLNAGVAAALLMFEAARQRRDAGR